MRIETRRHWCVPGAGEKLYVNSSLPCHSALRAKDSKTRHENRSSSTAAYAGDANMLQSTQTRCHGSMPMVRAEPSSALAGLNVNKTNRQRDVRSGVVHRFKATPKNKTPYQTTHTNSLLMPCIFKCVFLISLGTRRKLTKICTERVCERKREWERERKRKRARERETSESSGRFVGDTWDTRWCCCLP